MATSETIQQISDLLQKLADERRGYVEQIERIDAIFHQLNVQPPPLSSNPGRRARTGGRASGRKVRGLKAGGQRVQGVKQALLDSLSDTPQTPAQLKAKVCGKVGADVAITTQLAMLKKEKLAKSAARGQWVRA